jgi:hypothetical protein
MPLIFGMKMGWVMIVIKHPDDDTIKSTYLWHNNMNLLFSSQTGNCVSHSYNGPRFVNWLKLQLSAMHRACYLLL